ncbi:MAG TPA: hypothetical protein VKA60_15185, partial [Blastocatellia bacterium]|nr:hypothetical protein [Blastocatellia bacterium]
FSAWSRALQPAVMPIFTRALVSLRNTLPTLTPFVLGAVTAIKSLQDRASTSLKSPFWQGFKKDLQTSVTPAIVGLGVAFGNVITGMAGIIDAFLPHMDSISSTMQRITGRFAAWGAGLKGSPEFERFLAYSAEHGPQLADTFGKIFDALLNIGQALSPLSGPLLKLIGGLAQGVGWLAQHAPELVIAVYGLYVATKLWAAWQIIVNGAMAAFQVIASAGPWGWIVLAIAAVVLAVIYMYNHFTWFRDGVKAVWAAIQTAALFLWNSVLKPVFSFIWAGLQQIGRWAMWLWTNAIKPAWDAISLAARILVTAIVVLAILPIIAVFKILAAVGMWLWTNAIKPAFDGIATLAVWLYRNVFKPQFDAVMATFRAVARVGMWLWRNALAPTFRAIGDLAMWLYRNAIKPAWSGIVSAIKIAYQVGIKPIFDEFKDIVHSLKGAFDTAVAGIKTAWDKIKDVSRKPVQFVVDTVYNRGI